MTEEDKEATPQGLKSTVSTIEQLPPSEMDFHAYLDDELDPEQRVRVIEWLIAHPEKAKDLLEIQLREDLLKSAIRQSVNGKLTDELLGHLPQTEHLLRDRMRNKFAWGFGAGITAAALLLVVLPLIF